ncbi:potassium channel family protein [Pseudoalteromonas piscicida]|uniref:potassium channel family protein n=1 Tax=Pseudoalteromonas piscicida TaxID=43662 RepID=UPI0030EF9BA5
MLLFALVYFFLKSDFSHDDFGFVDSMYLSVVTITTLGYGDITPKSDILKIATSSQAFLGIMFFGLFLNSIANKVAQKEDEFAKLREKEQWKPVLKEIIVLCQEANVGSELLLTQIFEDKIKPHSFNHITKGIENKLSRIEKLIQSSVVGLGEKTPKLFLLMDEIEQLKLFSHFILYAFDKRKFSKVVICNDPIEIIRNNRATIASLKSEFDIDLSGKPNELVDIETYQNWWDSFKTVHHFNDKPETYTQSKPENLICLNIKVAVKLNLVIGSQVDIYDTQTS